MLLRKKQEKNCLYGKQKHFSRKLLGIKQDNEL